MGFVGFHLCRDDSDDGETQPRDEEIESQESIDGGLQTEDNWREHEVHFPIQETLLIFEIRTFGHAELDPAAVQLVCRLGAHDLLAEPSS